MKRTLSLIVALCVGLAVHVFGQGTVMPSPRFIAFDNNGVIVAGGKLCTYAAGTTTPLATYSDSDLAVGHTNTNPVIMDSAGRAIVYLAQTSYKFSLFTPGTDSTCNTGTLLWSQDNVSAVPTTTGNVDVTGTAGENVAIGQAVYLSDGSGGKNAGQWYRADASNLYSSTTPEIGIATNTIAAASSGTIRLLGRSTGLSGLTIGSEYFVGSTGALTATQPIFARHVGHADTTTSLIAEGPALPIADNAIDGFRITGRSLSPVPSTDVTAATSIFLTPYTGNRIALANSAGIATTYSSPEVSIAVPNTTSQMYDVFAFISGNTVTLEALAWTNDTTPSVAVSRANGAFLTKSTDMTRRYLGVFRTTGVSGQTEDSFTKRYIWNYYNRVRRPLQRFESTASWAYNGVVRQANGAAANQVEVVVGVAEVPISLFLQAASVNNGASAFVSIGIGEDSTTAYTVGSISSQAVANTGLQNMSCALNKVPAVGRHFYAWNEFASAATNTFVGASASGGSTITAGLTGFIEG